MNKSIGIAASATLMAVVFSQSANAITYDLVKNDIVNIPTTGGINTPTYILPGTVMDFPNGSSPGEYRSPWEGTLYDNQFYTSVRTGTAVYNLTGNRLNFFWGSLDDYNTLTFHTGENQTGFSVSIDGDELGGPMSAGHHWVEFLTDETFRSVSFASGQPAFEFANLTATPLPAALPLFASGLGLLGWSRLRRKLAVLRDRIIGRQASILKCDPCGA